MSALLARIARLEACLLFARHPVTVKDLKWELRRAQLQLLAVQSPASEVMR
jgi:hypothetical protein